MLRPRYAALLVLSIAAAFPARADPSCTTAQNAVQKPSSPMSAQPLVTNPVITSCAQSDADAVSAGQAAACAAYTAKALPPAPSISSCLSGILNMQVSSFTLPSLSSVLGGLATKVGNMACTAVQNSVNNAVNNAQQSLNNSINGAVNGAVNTVTNAVQQGINSAQQSVAGSGKGSANAPQSQNPQAIPPPPPSSGLGNLFSNH